MANRWSREEAIEIFGENMGRHFYDKWCFGGTQTEYDQSGNEREIWYPDLGTMHLFYEMSDNYLDVLVKYINENYDR